MKTLQGSRLAAVFCLFAGNALAQADPRARMLSPAPGSTLPGSTVTFSWSPAVGGGDYFLQVTAVPLVGQEIFYAPVKIESITLVNVPTNGETLYVYLFTRIKGVTLAPFSYAYRAAGAAPGAAASSGVVPIVLDVPGAAHYTSELQLTNLGTGSATVRLSYTGSIGTGAGEVVETVPPGEQVVFPDAISYLRSRGVPIPAPGGQGGTLVVSSATAGVRATVRTGADTADPQPPGRAGLAYSDAVPSALPPASRLWVHGLRSDAADRSNLALYNRGTDPVSVAVTLVSGEDGTSFDLTAGLLLSLPPLGWYQLNGVLAAAGFASGYAVVERVAGSGPIGAYGVVNDRLTNDGSFIPALEEGASGDRLTVPVLVETGSFESELILANRGSAAATFTLRYVESLTPSGGPGGSATLTVAAGRQLILPNALDFLRSNGVAVGPRGAAGYAGSLQVQVSGVGIGSTFAGARTSALSPAGGEFGLFTPAIGTSEEFSDQAFVLGLKADPRSRSNVAAVHTGRQGSGPITLELQVLDGSNGGRPVGPPLLATLGPGEWTQPQGFFAASGVPNGYVRIRRTAGTAPWYAYGVINDGSQPGQGTGDGSYVPGVRP